VLASALNEAHASYFQFPAWVEICRKKLGIAVPEDLAEPYHSAIAQLPALVGAASHRAWAKWGQSELLARRISKVVGYLRS
jgi:hypothetical protein